MLRVVWCQKVTVQKALNPPRKIARLHPAELTASHCINQHFSAWFGHIETKIKQSVSDSLKPAFLFASPHKEGPTLRQPTEPFPPLLHSSEEQTVALCL